MSKFALAAWTPLVALPSRAEPASRARALRRRQPSLLRRLCAGLLRAQERATMRHELRHMPDWLLQDLGITRHAALHEARLSFWRR
jgi:uncharacterized protein YjiS (DUF1127 family)